MCGGALTADITQKLNQNKIKKIKGAGGKGHAWDKNKACSARGHAKFHQIILKYENIKDTPGNMKRYKWLLQRDAEGFFVAKICDSAQSSASAIGLCLRTGSVLLSVASWVRFTSCLLCLRCVVEASEMPFFSEVLLISARFAYRRALGRYFQSCAKILRKSGI